MKPPLVIVTRQRLQIASPDSMTEDQLMAIVGLCQRRVRGVRSALAGANCASVGSVPGYGPVVVKHYRRGGLLRFVNDRRYWKWGARRCEAEYNLLMEALRIGINAPLPVAFVWRGNRWYRAWLITKEITDSRSLAEISLVDPDRAERMLDDLQAQLKLLIQHRLYHVDLHPGNVLVDAQDRLYVLDFDKATVFRGSGRELRDRYLRRWRRAVIKHALPELLSEGMCMRLRMNVEDEGAA